MTPRSRKLAVIGHLVFSVGWLGAVVSFLALSIVGLTSKDAGVIRAVYLAMDLIGQFTIVPLGFAALVTGLLLSFGTEWGLRRYYWVLVKFMLTVGAIAALLLHQFTAVREAARRVSAVSSEPLPQLGSLGLQLVVDAGAALMVLLAAVFLSVFKPWGRTPWGWRRPGASGGDLDSNQRQLNSPERKAVDAARSLPSSGIPLGLKIILAVVALLVVVFVVIHLLGGGLGRHGH